MFAVAVLTVHIGVFGLFHPGHLTVRALPAQVLMANGSPQTVVEVRLNNPPIVMTARDGEAADFILERHAAGGSAADAAARD